MDWEILRMTKNDFLSNKNQITKIGVPLGSILVLCCLPFMYRLQDDIICSW